MNLHSIFEIQYTKYTNIMFKVLTSLQFSQQDFMIFFKVFIVYIDLPS